MIQLMVLLVVCLAQRGVCAISNVLQLVTLCQAGQEKVSCIFIDYIVTFGNSRELNGARKVESTVGFSVSVCGDL